MLWKICFLPPSFGVLDILSAFDANKHFSDSRTHFAAAVFQQDVDVFLVLEMVIKVHNVFMVQYSVQLDLSVNLQRQKSHNCYSAQFLPNGGSAMTTAVARLPSPVGEVWRRAHVGLSWLRILCWWRGRSSRSILQNLPGK